MGIIVGIDEVGRGPWAGPVVSAAVAFPVGFKIRGVKDSKMLKHQQRLKLLPKIRQRALGIGIGWSAHTEVDRYGLTWAVQKSMERAIAQLSVAYDELIIDGKFNFLKLTHPGAQTIIKADRTYPCVSAASIVAKVARDLYMHQLARIYPNYGFEQHVGYGTPKHRERILAIGPSPIHRYSFRPLWEYRAPQLEMVE